MRNLNYLSLLDLQFPGKSVCFLHSREHLLDASIQCYPITPKPSECTGRGQVPVLPDHRMTYGG